MPNLEELAEELKKAVRGVLGDKPSQIFLGRVDKAIDEGKGVSLGVPYFNWGPAYVANIKANPGVEVWLRSRRRRRSCACRSGSRRSR